LKQNILEQLRAHRPNLNGLSTEKLASVQGIRIRQETFQRRTAEWSSKATTLTDFYLTDKRLTTRLKIGCDQHISPTPGVGRDHAEISAWVLTERFSNGP
jgi:hypothetical protein